MISPDLTVQDSKLLDALESPQSVSCTLKNYLQAQTQNRRIQVPEYWERLQELKEVYLQLCITENDYEAAADLLLEIPEKIALPLWENVIDQISPELGNAAQEKFFNLFVKSCCSSQSYNLQGNLFPIEGESPIEADPDSIISLLRLNGIWDLDPDTKAAVHLFTQTLLTELSKETRFSYDFSSTQCLPSLVITISAALYSNLPLADEIHEGLCALADVFSTPHKLQSALRHCPHALNIILDDAELFSALARNSKPGEMLTFLHALHDSISAIIEEDGMYDSQMSQLLAKTELLTLHKEVNVFADDLSALDATSPPPLEKEDEEFETSEQQPLSKYIVDVLKAYSDVVENHSPDNLPDVFRKESTMFLRKVNARVSFHYDQWHSHGLVETLLPEHETQFFDLVDNDVALCHAALTLSESAIQYESMLRIADYFDILQQRYFLFSLDDEVAQKKDAAFEGCFSVIDFAVRHGYVEECAEMLQSISEFVQTLPSPLQDEDMKIILKISQFAPVVFNESEAFNYLRGFFININKEYKAQTAKGEMAKLKILTAFSEGLLLRQELQEGTI